MASGQLFAVDPTSGEATAVDLGGVLVHGDGMVRTSFGYRTHDLERVVALCQVCGMQYARTALDEVTRNIISFLFMRVPYHRRGGGGGVYTRRFLADGTP